MIEVVTWASAAKSHALNQHWPYKTLCGQLLPQAVNRIEGVDALPTCKRCVQSVMKA